MDRLPDLDLLREELQSPYPTDRISADELGDTVARLVWESFSDHLVDPVLQEVLRDLGLPLEDGVPDQTSAEELLIFHLWVHSRAVQLSFVGRAPEPAVRAALDHLHRAVFEDMVANGAPKAQIPVFEQRVSARYAAYYAASEVSDERVGEVAVQQLTGAESGDFAAAARLLTECAVALANPLRDFLADVQITDPATNGLAG